MTELRDTQHDLHTEAEEVDAMSTVRHQNEAWTEEETAQFREELRTFREGLPTHQREAFGSILAGADAAFRLGTKAGASRANEKDASFVQALGTFRDRLPPRQRDAFISILTASTIAWGAAGGRALPARGKQGTSNGTPGVAYMWHALLTPLAVIAVGVVLIVEEASKGDDAQAPDLTGIPVSPEEPD